MPDSAFLKFIHPCGIEPGEPEKQGLRITARVHTGQGIRCRAVADELPAYARPEEPTLEDAYLYLISREVVR